MSSEAGVQGLALRGYMACASSFVHGLELSFLVHILGICMVPWDYGSRSLSVAGVGGLSSLTYSASAWCRGTTVHVH